MRVPPSTPDDLARGGVTIRVYRDSRAKLKELARLRGSKMAECFDALVTAALQEAYDEGLERSDRDQRELRGREEIHPPMD